jgi:hypothetical protein
MRVKNHYEIDGDHWESWEAAGGIKFWIRHGPGAYIRKIFQKGGPRWRLAELVKSIEINTKAQGPKPNVRGPFIRRIPPPPAAVQELNDQITRNRAELGRVFGIRRRR